MVMRADSVLVGNNTIVSIVLSTSKHRCGTFREGFDRLFIFMSHCWEQLLQLGRLGVYFITLVQCVSLKVVRFNGQKWLSDVSFISLFY